MARFPRLFHLASAALVLALVSMTADAQPPGRAKQRPGGRFGQGFRAPGFGGSMMGFGQSLTGLCRSETARNYAKISDQEAKQVEELAEKLRAQRRERTGDRPNFQEMTDAQRQARMEEFRKEAEKRNQELEAQLAKLLGSDKVAALKRIQWQMQGPRVLLNRGFQEEMGFSGALREQLQQIEQSAREKGRERFSGMFGEGRRPSAEDFQKMREAMEAAQKELGKELMGALPADMKAKLKEKLGKPVPGLDQIREELRASMRRPRGGPPGEGRPGGRGQRGEGRRGGGRRAEA
jgi:hypothetical protein